jgi:hypothetical protein
VHVHGGHLAMLRGLRVAASLAGAFAGCLEAGSYQGGGRYESLPGDAGGAVLVAEEAGEMAAAGPMADASAATETDAGDTVQ